MASNSVGTAYLTLVPKLDEGFAKQAEGALGKSGDAGGDKFADGFSGKFKEAFKKIAGAAVVVKAGQTVGEQFMAAFNGYADFEQLVGGVEKIFGENMSTQILADANNAYKNLNMSANEYLETINDVGANFKSTMGVEKGYKTAQIGLQAIADYASGTGKNIDELKEKFTLITRATSSYQSIADQFSGILPATSEQFLKQAQAAGFLNDSYTKLTDVPIDEYQEAVSKMLEKGTSDLGLANNTFNETLGTLSGSLAGTKAAWSDFLVALGDPKGDIDGAVSKLVEMGFAAGKQIVDTAGRIVGSIASNLPQWMQKIGGFILTNAPKIGEAVGNLIGKVVGWLVSSLPDIISGAGTLFGGLLTALVFAGANLLGKLGEIISKAVSNIAGSVGSMLSAGTKWMSGLSSAISGAFGGIISAVGSVITGAINKVVSFASSMWSAGSQLIWNAINAISGAAGSLWNTVSSMFWSAVDTVRGFAGNMWSAASDVIQGLINGLWDAAGGVADALWNIASGAVDSFKRFFGIASPSKLMRKMGGYVGEGLTLGISDSEKDVDRAMSSLMDSAYVKAADYGIGINASLNSGRGTINADVVGAIDMLHNDLYSIIKDATPDGITGRQFGRLVHKYA